MPADLSGVVVFEGAGEVVEEVEQFDGGVIGEVGGECDEGWGIREHSVFSRGLRGKRRFQASRT